MEGGVGELHLRLDADSSRDPEVGPGLEGKLQQRRLAHAGLSPNHERPAAPRPHVVEQPFQRLALGAPTQQHLTAPPRAQLLVAPLTGIRVAISPRRR